MLMEATTFEYGTTTVVDAITLISSNEPYLILEEPQCAQNKITNFFIYMHILRNNTKIF